MSISDVDLNVSELEYGKISGLCSFGKGLSFILSSYIIIIFLFLLIFSFFIVVFILSLKTFKLGYSQARLSAE